MILFYYVFYCWFTLSFNFGKKTGGTQERGKQNWNFHWIIHLKQKIPRQIYHYGDCVAEKIAQTANRKHNECVEKFENEIEIWLVRIICKGLFVVNTCILHTHIHTAHVRRGKPMTMPDEKNREKSKKKGNNRKRSTSKQSPKISKPKTVADRQKTAKKDGSKQKTRLSTTETRLSFHRQKLKWSALRAKGNKRWNRKINHQQTATTVTHWGKWERPENNIKISFSHFKKCCGLTF